jgi:hypothetical protein
MGVTNDGAPSSLAQVLGCWLKGHCGASNDAKPLVRPNTTSRDL